MNDYLPLGYRYQAAWDEHATRISQRQAVIQMYLAAAGVVYGFWFQARPAIEKSPHQIQQDPISLFTILFMTFLTISCSALIWNHNRVLQHLTDFMCNCERYAATAISECGGEVNLFYFFDADKNEIRGIHFQHRRYNRFILAAILFLTNLVSIPLTWGKVSPICSGVAVFLLPFAPGFMIVDMYLDRKHYPDPHASQSENAAEAE